MHIRVSLVCLFLLFSLNGFSQSVYKVMAIGFYNCENFFDTIHDPNKKDQETTPGPKDYLAKQHNIATAIEALGKDVTPDGAAMVGLAEIENDNVIKDLIAQPELAGRHYKYAWFYTPDERGISTALIYNPKYLKVIGSEPIHVPTETMAGKRPTRDILHVYGVLAGDTVHIFVNHWPSKTGGESATAPLRRLAATIAKRVLDSLMNVNPESKIIFMGDFNDNPTSEGIKDILHVEREKKDVDLTGIYDPFYNMYKKGLGSESYQHEWNMIDQIMVSGALVKNNNRKWKYHNAEVFSKDFLVYHTGYNKGLPHRSYTITHAWDNGYSDHFPVLLYLVEKK